MLLGRFEEGRVTNTNPELGSGRPDEATVDLRPFNLDMLGSLANGQIKGQGPLSGTRRVQLSEEEVARLASSSALGMDVMGVDLGEEYLTGGSGAEVLGARLPVRMKGGYTRRDGELRFEPRRLETLGARVPRRFTQDLLRGASFAYPVELPFGRSPALKCVKTISCSLARWRICPSDEVWVPVASPGSLWYLLLGLQVPEGGTRRPVC
jgi:hypothetical protein